MTLPDSSSKTICETSIGQIELSAKLPLSLVIEHHGRRLDLSDEEVVRLILKRTATVVLKAPTEEFLARLNAVDIESIALALCELHGVPVVATVSSAKSLREYLVSCEEKIGALGASTQIPVAQALQTRAIPQIFDLKPVAGKSGGQKAVEQLERRIDERKGEIADDRIVSLIAVAAPGSDGFFISDFKYSGDYIILTGVPAANGSRPAEILQHYTQLNVMITDVPAENAQIGFV